MLSGRFTVQIFLATIPATLQATVKQVCTNLWDGYASAVAAALPDARIVVDRFHVAAQHREAFDDLRKAECQELNSKRKLLKRRCFGWGYRGCCRFEPARG